MAKESSETLDTKKGHENEPAPVPEADDPSNVPDDSAAHAVTSIREGKNGSSVVTKPCIKIPFNWTKIGESIKVGAAIATILGAGGLIYLSIQTRQNAHGQIYQQMVEIDKFFIEHPEWRRYIYSSTRPEEFFKTASQERLETEKARAEATAEMMLDFLSQVALMMPSMGEERENWETYIKEIFKRSCVLQDFYNDNKDWYTNEKITNLLIDALGELDKKGNPCQTPKTLPSHT